MDDRKQLKTIAALLAANPKLKPTTAIRSLGIEDPSTIRRLRDKFRNEQAKLMADAHRAERAQRVQPERAGSNGNAPPRKAAPVPFKSAIHCQAPPAAVAETSPTQLFSDLCDLGFSAVSAAVETQCAFTRFWFELPHVTLAARGQLTLNSIAVAIYTRNKTCRLSLH